MKIRPYAILAGLATTAFVFSAGATTATAATSSCRTEGDRVCATQNQSNGNTFLTIHAAGEPVATVRLQQDNVQVRRFGTYDGHRDCYALIGDTSVITCADGFVTTS